MKWIGRHFAFCTVLLLSGISAVVCLAGYKGHQEKDMAVLLAAYPDVAGTALDDCAACHRSGAAPVPGDPQGRIAKGTSCDYCHADMLAKGLGAEGALNAYGHAYLKGGRTAAALHAVESGDSDGDGASNIDEIRARTLPGDPDAHPALAIAPQRTLTLDQLKKRLPVYTTPQFMNVSKSPDGDRYDDLTGFLLMDVLIAAGVADNAESVDVISIDGYAKTFTIPQIMQMYRQAAPVFGLGKDDLGECGWVQYNAARLVAGEPLPLAGVMLTFAMNGREYEPAHLDPQSGKLRGTGPFRGVGPQMIHPGAPDQSSRADAACIDVVPEIYRYHKEGYEKNSDYCVKAVAALRVNPLPKGTRDPQWQPQAMKLIEDKSILVYGALKQQD